MFLYSKRKEKSTVRKYWAKARPIPTRANNKLFSSIPNVWDFSFKRLRWICPSRFVVCKIHLSLGLVKFPI